MNTSIRNQTLFVHNARIANVDALRPTSMVSRTIGVAKRRREQMLAVLAFVMLIVAWDATLRLDERMSPPRMRLSHAVEREVEMHAEVLAP